MSATSNIIGIVLLMDGHTHTRFARKSVDLTEDMLNSHVIMPAKKVASLKDCSFACRDEGTCMSFIHQTTKGTQWCTGYNAGTAVPGKISSQKSVFFNMEQKHGLYVPGSYYSQIWVYNGGVDKIDSTLWSPSNPDPSQGHCVMLRQAGLASVGCELKLFSICGY